MNKTKDHSIRKVLIAVVIIDLIYLVLELLNIPSNIIKVCNINFPLLIAIMNNTTTISIFTITYFKINQKNMEKIEEDKKISENQRKIAKIILLDVHATCRLNMYFFNDEEESKPIIDKITKYDSDSIRDNPIVQYYMDLPFKKDTENMIYEFAINGIINKKIYADFLEMKKIYQNYIFHKAESLIKNEHDTDNASLVKILPMLEEAIKKFEKEVNKL